MKKKHNQIDILQEKQVIEGELINSPHGKVVYFGIDPTYSSLHLGHLLLLNTASILENEYKLIIIIGDYTSLIGDPSGKNKERKLLPSSLIEKNSLFIERQIKNFFNFTHLEKDYKQFLINKRINIYPPLTRIKTNSLQKQVYKILSLHKWKEKQGKEEDIEKLLENYQNLAGHPISKFKIIRNSSWYKKMPLMKFLRKIGKHFTLAELMAKKMIKERMKTGISFSELSYSLMQAYDFYYLNKKFNCWGQIGGSDQRTNITGAIDFIRKKLPNTKKEKAWGITIRLLTDSSGIKLSKTNVNDKRNKNQIWLDPSLTSSYELYQFLFNRDDKEAKNFLYLLTPFRKYLLDKILTLHQSYPQEKVMQILLAEIILIRIHGIKELNKVNKINEIVFDKVFPSLDDLKLLIQLLDKKHIFRLEKSNQICLLSLLVQSKMTKSKKKAREFIKNGAIKINGKIFKKYSITAQTIEDIFLVKVGKTDFFLVEITSN